MKKRFFAIAAIALLAVFAAGYLLGEHAPEKSNRSKLLKERNRIEKEIEMCQDSLKFVHSFIFSQHSGGSATVSTRDFIKDPTIIIPPVLKNDSLKSIVKSYRSRIDSLRSVLRSYPLE